MTYCLGILLKDGLVLAADSRTNAGVDQIALVSKLNIFDSQKDRLICLMSAGNLATTQSVAALLDQALGTGEPNDMYAADTMFDIARIVGDTLRAEIAREAKYVEPFGSPDGSFIVAGQIEGGQHRLFQIYSAGNFIEATRDTPFLQIGETKYGKPILDRIINQDVDLDSACKCAILSMDATIRSNLSVAPPIHLLRYKSGNLSTYNHRRIADDDAYFLSIRKAYAQGLRRLFNRLPNPDWGK
ncbi:MAG: peptidase [Alphaproteobacteria bacterium]